MSQQPERSDLMDKIMILVVLTPVTSAMFTGPLIGLTLITLGLLDSAMLIATH